MFNLKDVAIKSGVSTATVSRYINNIGFMDEFEIIGDVRGLGLLISIELVEDKKSKIPNFKLAEEIWRKCSESGLLFHLSARGDTVNLEFTPPLIITKEQVDQAISILRGTFIKSVKKNNY